jgi:hypothetical protein
MRLVCYCIVSYRSWALPLVGATDYGGDDGAEKFRAGTAEVNPPYGFLRGAILECAA